MLTPSARDPAATDRSQTAPALLEDHGWRRSTRSRCNAAGSGCDGRGGRRPSSRARSASARTQRPAKRHAHRVDVRSDMDLCGARPCRFPGSAHGCPKHCHPATASAHDTHCDAYVLLFLAALALGWCTFRSRTTLEPTAGVSADPARTRDGVSRHPARRTLAAVEPSTCPDGAATKAPPHQEFDRDADLVQLLYTSGATSRPSLPGQRGVQLRHRHRSR
jgi:hypothetical protein